MKKILLKTTTFILLKIFLFSNLFPLSAAEYSYKDIQKLSLRPYLTACDRKSSEKLETALEIVQIQEVLNADNLLLNICETIYNIKEESLILATEWAGVEAVYQKFGEKTGASFLSSKDVEQALDTLYHLALIRKRYRYGELSYRMRSLEPDEWKTIKNVLRGLSVNLNSEERISAEGQLEKADIVIGERTVLEKLKQETYIRWPRLTREARLYLIKLLADERRQKDRKKLDKKDFYEKVKVFNNKDLSGLLSLYQRENDFSEEGSLDKALKILKHDLDIQRMPPEFINELIQLGKDARQRKGRLFGILEELKEPVTIPQFMELVRKKYPAYTRLSDATFHKDIKEDPGFYCGKLIGRRLNKPKEVGSSVVRQRRNRELEILNNAEKPVTKPQFIELVRKKYPEYAGVSNGVFYGDMREDRRFHCEKLIWQALREPREISPSVRTRRNRELEILNNAEKPISKAELIRRMKIKYPEYAGLSNQTFYSDINEDSRLLKHPKLSFGKKVDPRTLAVRTRRDREFEILNNAEEPIDRVELIRRMKIKYPEYAKFLSYTFYSDVNRENRLLKHPNLSFKKRINPQTLVARTRRNREFGILNNTKKPISKAELIRRMKIEYPKYAGILPLIFYKDINKDSRLLKHPNLSFEKRVDPRTLAARTRRNRELKILNKAEKPISKAELIRRMKIEYPEYAGLSNWTFYSDINGDSRLLKHKSLVLKPKASGHHDKMPKSVTEPDAFCADFLSIKEMKRAAISLTGGHTDWQIDEMAKILGVSSNIIYRWNKDLPDARLLTGSSLMRLDRWQLKSLNINNLKHRAYRQAFELANGDISKVTFLLGVSKPTVRNWKKKCGYKPKAGSREKIIKRVSQEAMVLKDARNPINIEILTDRLNLLRKMTGHKRVSRDTVWHDVLGFKRLLTYKNILLGVPKERKLPAPKILTGYQKKELLEEAAKKADEVPESTELVNDIIWEISEVKYRLKNLNSFIKGYLSKERLDRAPLLENVVYLKIAQKILSDLKDITEAAEDDIRRLDKDFGLTIKASFMRFTKDFKRVKPRINKVEEILKKIDAKIIKGNKGLDRTGEKIIADISYLKLIMKLPEAYRQLLYITGKRQKEQQRIGDDEIIKNIQESIEDFKESGEGKDEIYGIIDKLDKAGAHLLAAAFRKELDRICPLEETKIPKKELQPPQEISRNFSQKPKARHRPPAPIGPEWKAILKSLESCPVKILEGEELDAALREFRDMSFPALIRSAVNKENWALAKTLIIRNIKSGLITSFVKEQPALKQNALLISKVKTHAQPSAKTPIVSKTIFRKTLLAISGAA